jgi:hypothetical protein
MGGQPSLIVKLMIVRRYVERVVAHAGHRQSTVRFSHTRAAYPRVRYPAQTVPIR